METHLVDNLNNEQRDFWKKLDAFDAPFLEEKLLQEGVFSTHEEYAVAFTEFKKYLALGKWTDRNVAMCSKKVDAIWHQFILFTHDYFSFCNQFFGYYIHHNPRTNSRPLDEDGVPRFVSSYNQFFGEMNSMWKANSHAPIAVCSDDDHSSKKMGMSMLCTPDDAKKMALNSFSPLKPVQLGSNDSDCDSSCGCGSSK